MVTHNLLKNPKLEIRNSKQSRIYKILNSKLKNGMEAY